MPDLSSERMSPGKPAPPLIDGVNAAGVFVFLDPAASS